MGKLKYLGLITLGVLVLLTGCTESEEPFEDDPSQELPEQVTSDIVENQEIIKMAEEFINQLNEGDYDRATENFDGGMNDAIDAEGLEQLWLELENELGNFISQEFDSTSESEGYQIVFITGIFNDRDITFQVVFNENNEISGFFLV